MYLLKQEALRKGLKNDRWKEEMRTDRGAMSGPTEVFWADVSGAMSRGRQGGERAVAQKQAPFAQVKTLT